MKKTRATLADGRELLYFDEDDAPLRDLHDPRALPEQSSALELRWDPLVETWVAIASHRQARTHLPAERDCPLCPSRPGHPTEIPARDYDVVSFENRFPSFSAATGGRCEVVCFTSRHDLSFAELTIDRARLVVDVWADRTSELGSLPGVEQVFCFENRGDEIGATLQHPHGQIYAYPFVAPRTERMLRAARRHRDLGGENLFAEVLERERRAGTRIVAERATWTAFVPEFARWPFEVHLYPSRRVPDLPGLTSGERDDFAELYLEVLGGFARLFELPMPYIAAWHQAPVYQGRDLAYLHLQLFSVRRAEGKLKYLAGSESGMEVWINDVLPEDAAHLLRQAISRAPSDAAHT